MYLPQRRRKDDSPHYHQAQAQHPLPQMILHISQDEGQVIQEQKLEKENGQEEGQENEKILNKKGKATRRMANQRMVLSGYNTE